MTEDAYPYPFGYAVSLCPAEPDPPFEEAGQQRLVWGAEWGAADEVGRLRSVLVRRIGIPSDATVRATMLSSPRRMAGAMRPMIAPPGTVHRGSRV